RKLRELKMPTPFGSYMGFENVSEWTANFPAGIRIGTNCAWVSIGDCKLSSPNTTLAHAIETNGWPRIPSFGSIAPSREHTAAPIPKQTLLNSSTRLITYTAEGR